VVTGSVEVPTPAASNPSLKPAGVNEQEVPKAAAAEVPQPAPTMSPEVVVAQLRAMRAQLGEVAPLARGQRKALRSRARTSNPILQASINVIGAFDNVSLAIGHRPTTCARCTKTPTAGRR
jgi:hypothetical protein